MRHDIKIGSVSREYNVTVLVEVFAPFPRTKNVDRAVRRAARAQMPNAQSTRITHVSPFVNDGKVRMLVAVSR